MDAPAGGGPRWGTAGPGGRTRRTAACAAAQQLRAPPLLPGHSSTLTAAALLWCPELYEGSTERAAVQSGDAAIICASVDAVMPTYVFSRVTFGWPGMLGASTAGTAPTTGGLAVRQLAAAHRPPPGVPAGLARLPHRVRTSRAA